jgi:PAS domain S-box-containing protein
METGAAMPETNPPEKSNEELRRELEKLRQQIAKSRARESQYAQAQGEIFRLATTVNQAGEGLVVINSSGTILSANPAFEAITGCAQGEIVGRKDEEFFHHCVDGEALYTQMRTALDDEDRWHGQLTRKHRDGRSVEETCSVSAIRDAAGQLTHYVSVHRDVSEQNLLEKQLSKTQQMEAIGRLAAGVAHDFNNLLQVIIGCSEILHFSLPADSFEATKLNMILEAGNRGHELTRQLLAFSRKQVLQPKVLNLNAVVSELEGMLRPLIGEDIVLATVLEPDLAPLRADANQLEQVLMNLAVNARDAMPQGGRLSIQTANAELGPNDVARYRYVEPGAYVRLQVSDTGQGMDAKILSHIFEPFFTTKESGKGTGLGLSTVYGIIKQSGGYIWAESQPGQGTTFTIYLPQAEEAGTASESSAVPASMRRGTETVLVVDDEEAVATTVGAILTKGGYTVLQARSAGDALLVSERHEGPVHLLLTDVVMPTMNGRELAERLTAARPEMRVLYMSGYADNVIVSHGVLAPEVELLQKPFASADLTLKVRAVLDRP